MTPIQTSTPPSGIRALRQLPGVGPAVARDLVALGVRQPADLRGRDPDVLYERLIEIAGGPVDRCMLYTLRCAIYAAEDGPHDPELMRWWAWSDANLARRRA
ncbi:MAG: helix-hairpin-helix domain-containing protein [Dehalococcoidia bacterium]